MIIITVVKDNPNAFLETYNSVCESYIYGLNVQSWIIKLSDQNDTSLSLTNSLPAYAKVYYEVDSGIYDAFNVAIDNIEDKHKEEFVLFLNAGDTLIPQSAKSLNLVIEACKGYYQIIIGSSKIKGKTEGYVKPIPSIIGVGGLNFCHQSILYEAKLLVVNKYPLNCRIAGDYAHFLKLKGKPTLTTDFCFTNYSLDGISERNLLKTRLDNFKAGIDFYGVKEIYNLFKMLLVRLIIKL